MPSSLRGTIKFKTAIVVLVVVGALWLIVSLVADGTYKNYRRLQIAECRSLVDSKTERTNDNIRLLEANAAELALIGELYFRDGSDSDLLWRYAVRRNFEINRLAVGGGIWFEPYAVAPDRLRSCIYAFNDGREVVTDDSFETPKYDYHGQIWYRTIKDRVSPAKGVAWSPAYTDESGTESLMTTVGCAIFDDSGRFVGMSTVDWQLGSIAETLADMKPTASSFALFADPHFDQILALSDPNRRDDLSAGSLSALEWYDGTSGEESEFVYLGRRYLSFKRILDNGMLFVSNVPADELFREIDVDIKQMLTAFAVACALLSAAVYYMLNRFVNKPVVYLSQKAREIGAGNLDTEIRIDSGDEFAELAATLTDMTRNIRDHMERLGRVTADKERITTELDIATDIQTSLIPTTFPAFPDRADFDIFAQMRPAREVGGDFYDFFMIGEDNLAVIIADVSGKGVPAALFMVIARTLIKNHAQMGLSPGEVFGRTNEQLCENNSTGMFVTAFMGILNVKTGLLTYVNAGHNPPFFSTSGGPFEIMRVKPGFVLGGLEEIRYIEETVTMGDGDRLFIYTDGVTEAENGNHDLFGEERLLDVLNDGKSDADDIVRLVKRVAGAADDFAGGTEQSDDMTMLVLLKTDETLFGGHVDKIVVDADIGRLPEVLDFLRKLGGGLDAKKMMQLEVAAEEIFVNICRYAYTDATGDVVIEVWREEAPKRLTVRFIDSGLEYNPLDNLDPDTTLRADERPIGGLGVFLARQNVDGIVYERSDNLNILTMVKNEG